MSRWSALLAAQTGTPLRRAQVTVDLKLTSGL
jgi:hypothetical protein